MCPSGELSYGSEPHGLIYSRPAAVPVDRVDDGGREGVYPGWGMGGCLEGTIPGTTHPGSRGQFEAYL